MRFLIVAIDHGWQLVSHGPETPESTEDKNRLEVVVRKAIAERGVNLICEESDPCRLSIAQKIAYEYKPSIPWKNINMSAQERLEAGIWEALLNRPYRAVEEPAGSGNYRTIHHRIPQDDAREGFFAKESIRAANAAGAGSILILCGDMHADFVKRILGDLKFQAEANHDLIPHKYWE